MPKEQVDSIFVYLWGDPPYHRQKGFVKQDPTTQEDRERYWTKPTHLCILGLGLAGGIWMIFFTTNLYRSVWRSVWCWSLGCIFVYLVSSVGAEVSHRSFSLRVMTYNIRHSRGLDEIHDLRRIATLIRNTGADIVALQEVDVGTRRVGGINQPQQLAQWTGMYVAFGTAIPFQNGLFGNAILSRYPILRQNTRQISGPEGAEIRILLEAQLNIPVPSHKQNSFILTVWNTHFDYQSEKIRIQSVQRIGNWISSTSGPLLLLGDFNAEPHAESIQLMGQSLQNASSSRITPTIPSDSPTQQLDYIWFRPSISWKLKNIQVLHDPISHIASDHRPLLADFMTIPSLLSR